MRDLTSDLIPIGCLPHLEKTGLAGAEVDLDSEKLPLVIVKHGRGASDVSVFEGLCPHRGAMLAEGTVQQSAQGTHLICGSHHWSFSCPAGLSATNPRIGLKRFRTHLLGETIHVERSELLLWNQSRPKPRNPLALQPALAPRELPGPRGLPWIGNLLQMDLRRIHQTFEKWAGKHGSFYRFRLGMKSFVVVSDPEAVQQILRDRPSGFRRMRSIESVLNEMAGPGLFSAEGAVWRRQREMTAPAFNARHLKQFFPTVIEMTERLERRLRRASKLGQPFEIRNDLMRYTIDVTTNLAFNHDLNTLESDGGDLQKHLETVFPMIARRINAPFPYWRYVKLPADRAVDRALQAIQGKVDQMIRATRQRLRENRQLADHPTNFLEALLCAHDAQGKALSDSEIFGNILTILVAGEDTTANSLAWMIHFLCEHPDVQEKMAEESRRLLGDRRSITELSQTDDFPYLDAVAQESMRLKPVAPFLWLEANTEARVGRVMVPARTPVIALTTSEGLKDVNFTHAAQFRPERWMPTRPPEWNHHPKVSLPFGSGTRFCPGRSLALLEIKLAMAMFARCFSVSRAPGRTPVDEAFTFATIPVGLQVLLKER